MLVASSLEYICPHEPQKPAVFAATAIPPQIRQAIAKATKAKAGSNTSRASPVISAVMVRGVVPHARQSCAGGGKKQDVYSGACDRGRTTLVCQTLNSLRINQNACGSFPAIRQATGRKARGFSLFMKIFRFKAFPFFFSVT